MVVKTELEKLGLSYSRIELGETEIIGDISPAQLNDLDIALRQSELELLNDHKAILVEKIKTIIIDQVHHIDDQVKVNFSDFLSEKLNHNYTYLANIFSDIVGVTIEQFYISHKIEKVKELLAYGDLNLSEIAWKLHYSSVAHLSFQFKKKTGMTPSQFKNLRKRNRMGLDNV
jgi:AraC-like DNA-binding protein